MEWGIRWWECWNLWMCVGVWSGGATLENQKEENRKFGNYPPFWKEFTVTMKKWQALTVVWWMLKVFIICIISVFRCKQFTYFLIWLKYTCIIGISIIGNDYHFMVKKIKHPINGALYAFPHTPHKQPQHKT